MRPHLDVKIVFSLSRATHFECLDTFDSNCGPDRQIEKDSNGGQKEWEARTRLRDIQYEWRLWQWKYIGSKGDFRVNGLALSGAMTYLTIRV